MQWQEIVPVPGHQAFRATDPSAIYSQAAFLLVLARHSIDRGSGSRTQLGSDNVNVDDDVDDPDTRELDVPLWAHPALGSNLAIARMRWFERHAADSARPQPSTRDAALLARELYDIPSADSAVDLIQACLDSPHPVVRVAAAAADLQLDLQAQDIMSARLSLPASSMYARIHLFAQLQPDLMRRRIIPTTSSLPRACRCQNAPLKF